MIAKAITRSGNRKIGDASTTYAAQQSCPQSCAFKDGGGCYAESGLLAIHSTRPLNAAGEELDADALDVAVAEAVAIDEMKVVEGRPMRLHTVGDCASNDAALIVSAASARYRERGGGPVWTYTHGWREVDRVSWGAVSVLASCETIADIEQAHARGYAAAIVVDEFADRKLYKIGPPRPRDPQPSLASWANGWASAESDEAARGAEVLPCPQMTSGTTCTECRLCFDDAALRERGYAIGFEVHGTGLAVKKAKMALDSPDDPRRKLTSRDFIASFLEEHGRWPTNREVCEGVSVTRGSAYEMLVRMKEEAA